MSVIFGDGVLDAPLSCSLSYLLTIISVVFGVPPTPCVKEGETKTKKTKVHEQKRNIPRVKTYPKDTKRPLTTHKTIKQK